MTNMFTAKRILLERLAVLCAQAAEGTPLYQVQVEYAWPGSPPGSDVCIYGEDPSFERRPDDDMADGVQEANAETGFVVLVVRATVAPTPVDGVRITDETVAAVAVEIDRLLRRERDLAGPNTYAQVVDGRAANYSDDERAVSSLLLRIGVDSYVVDLGEGV